MATLGNPATVDPVDLIAAMTALGLAEHVPAVEVAVCELETISLGDIGAKLRGCGVPASDVMKVRGHFRGQSVPVPSSPVADPIVITTTTVLVSCALLKGCTVCDCVCVLNTHVYTHVHRRMPMCTMLYSSAVYVYTLPFGVVRTINVTVFLRAATVCVCVCVGFRGRGCTCSGCILPAAVHSQG